MKHTCCLLFPLLILASGGIAMDTPPNREVQINVLQFLHRDSASTVVDAHLIKREIESTLLKCGRTCEASLRSVRRIEPVEQLFSSVRDIGTPAADREHDVLNVWGWVESFDVSRVRMILSLETTNSGSYAFFHDVEIQAGRIVRWDGRQCNLDMMALASPISVFAIVVADNNQTERGALRKFIEECSPHARHICADAEFEYLRAGGARPPETSKAVRLLYGEAQSDSALLPIPALWHRDLIRFMTRSAGPSPYAVPTIAVSTGKSTEWPIAVAVGAAGVGALVGLSQLFQGSESIFRFSGHPDDFTGKGSGFRLETGAGRLQILLLLGSLAGSAALASDWFQIGAGYTPVEIDVPERLIASSIVDRSYRLEKGELRSRPHYELRFPISEHVSTRMSVQDLKQTYQQHCELRSAGLVCNDTASLEISLFTLRTTADYSVSFVTPALRMSGGIGFESVLVRLWNNHPMFVSPDTSDSRIVETSLSDLKFSTVLNLGLEYRIADIISLCIDAGLRFPNTYRFDDGFWIRRGVGHLAFTALIDLGKVQ